MPDPTQPDREEYAAILDELTEAKKNVHRLSILDRYAHTEGKFGAGAHNTLLSYLTKGSQVTAKQITYDLAAQTVRVGVLEELLADWTARSDAYQESAIQDAPEPAVA